MRQRRIAGPTAYPRPLTLYGIRRFLYSGFPAIANHGDRWYTSVLDVPFLLPYTSGFPMRYGIFGGAFDPIHLGHLLLAETALRQTELDRVIFVPTGVSPHRSGKGTYHASAENRFQMIEAAIAGCEEFLVSRREIDRKEPSFTVETLRYFKKAFALMQPEFFLILGADMFNDLPNWREAGEVCRLATPLIACRPGTTLPQFEELSRFVSGERYDEIQRLSLRMPQLEISSTAIRAAVAAGNSIRFQVPRNVDAYIRKHKLYRP